MATFHISTGASARPLTLSRTGAYRSWDRMLSRCRNPRDGKYKDYGARGIIVCERWNLFANFFADMGERPAGLTIERMDVNGNYEPGNCKWATPKEQGRNKRNTVFLTHNGERRCLAEWAEVTGIGISTLSFRLRKGWPVADVLTTGIHKRKRIGHRPTAEQLARRMGRGKGIPLSEEHCRRLSEAHKGYVVKEATKAKLSAANRGKPWNEKRRAADDLKKQRRALEKAESGN